MPVRARSAPRIEDLVGEAFAQKQFVVHEVGSTIHATVLGASEQQVGAALERLVTPAGKRIVTYKAPHL